MALYTCGYECDRYLLIELDRVIRDCNLYARAYRMMHQLVEGIIARGEHISLV